MGTFRAGCDGSGSVALRGCCAAPRLLGAPLLLSPACLSGALHLSESPPVELLLLWPFPGAPTHPGHGHRARLVSQPPRLCNTRPTASLPEECMAGKQQYHTLVSLHEERPGRPPRQRETATWLETLEQTGMCIVGPHPAAAICREESARGTPRG